MSHTNTSDMAGVVQRLIAEHRLRDVLRLLNDRVEHRFTGLYRFDPPMLRNVALFDAANPDIEVGSDTPLRETYCCVVGETGAPFETGVDVVPRPIPAGEISVLEAVAPLIARHLRDP